MRSRPAGGWWRLGPLALAAAMVLSCAPAGAASGTAATPALTGAPLSTIPPRTGRPTAEPVAIPRAASGTVTVDVGEHFFDPADLEVTAGTKVTWRMVGQSEHDVTAADGAFVSSSLGPGATFSYTFTTPGRFAYVCTQHAGMRGEIAVR